MRKSRVDLFRNQCHNCQYGFKNSCLSYSMCKGCSMHMDGKRHDCHCLVPITTEERKSGKCKFFKHNKVYVIIKEYSYHGSTFSYIVNDEAYSDRDKCLKLFKSFVKQMKETDTDYKNCKPECIIDEEDTFKFWEDGNYADNHYSICIRGLALKEVE